MQPLKQLDEATGQHRYPYIISPDSANRLADAFALARYTQADAPLVPELQVVLNHLLQQARDRSSEGDDRGVITVEVPEADALETEIYHALTQHVERALDAAFPLGRETGPGKTARTRALIALRKLADAEGRRREGLPDSDVIRMIGPEGQQVLDRLSAADTRLVVTHDGRCTLSHDRLAKVVTEIVANEASRGRLLLDQALLDLSVKIDQKLALYQSDARDESSLSLASRQRKLIASNRDTLLFDETRRQWWTAAESVRWRRTKVRVGWGAGAAAVLLSVSVSVRYFSLEGQRTELTGQRLRLAVLERLSTADYQGLVSLARDPANPWDKVVLSEEVLARVDPVVFETMPWRYAPFDASALLDTIEQGYRLYVPSRPLFGAMSFGLEEVWLRTRDAAVRQRAQGLAETVRKAFVDYHSVNTAGFELPPARAADDSLNRWVTLPGGTFMMGSQDGEDDERPPHQVSVTAFLMQQHEVTNLEYRTVRPCARVPGRAREAPRDRVVVRSGRVCSVAWSKPTDGSGVGIRRTRDGRFEGSQISLG